MIEGSARCVGLSVYFESFHYSQPIKIELLEGERIVSVDGADYRRVWIEGTEATAAERFDRENQA